MGTVRALNHIWSKYVCEAFGLDPDKVLRLTLELDATQTTPILTVVMTTKDEEMKKFVQSMQRYTVELGPTNIYRDPTNGG